MKKNSELKTFDVCVVCLRDMWDCTCAHDKIQDGQFIVVGEHTMQQIAEVRRNEEKKKNAPKG